MKGRLYVGQCLRVCTSPYGLGENTADPEIALDYQQSGIVQAVSTLNFKVGYMNVKPKHQGEVLPF